MMTHVSVKFQDLRLHEGNLFVPTLTCNISRRQKRGGRRYDVCVWSSISSAWKPVRAPPLLPVRLTLGAAGCHLPPAATGRRSFNQENVEYKKVTRQKDEHYRLGREKPAAAFSTLHNSLTPPGSLPLLTPPLPQPEPRLPRFTAQK